MPTQKRKPTMTSKEALGVLDELYDAYARFAHAGSLDAWQKDRAFRDRALDAIFRLTDLIHGPRLDGEMVLLCSQCRVQRVAFAFHERMRCADCGQKDTNQAPIVPGAPVEVP